MKLTACLVPFIVPLMLVLPRPIFAQVPDSVLLARSVLNAKMLYFEKSAENAHIYTGSEYVVSDYGIIGSRFFLTPNPQIGSVFFAGELFENVPLYYDLFQDKIVTQRFNQMFRIWLPEDKVEYFKMAEHLFVRLHPDSSYKGTPETGFYELIYSGNSAVYLKRKIRLDEKVTADGTTTKFINEDRFYIRKGNTFYRLSGKKNLFKVLNERKKELKRFARKYDLDFKSDPGAAFSKVVAYYDQLNKS